MSGSPFSQIPRSQELLSLAVRQARLVDCPDSLTRAIVDCLRTVPWRRLGDSLKGFRDFSIDPIIIWRPVIERDYGQERFLAEDPMVSIREGRISSVPFIVSQTRDEFFWEAFLVLDNFIHTSLINSDWYRVSPIAFMLPSPSNHAAAVLGEAYVGNQPLENNTEDAQNLGKLYGDAVIGFGVHRKVLLFLQLGVGPPRPVGIPKH
ncbi:juvenile hormone esterase-like [Pieris brassicae]|uniref:juvenile hormone esterase-like n=1 Tax=Pieris brassicae TaxID=7116 RepID=UPI001E662196|nr:juvenile hormone esterase-like [Pieris brassicae]